MAYKDPADQAAWYQANKERIAAKNHALYVANKEKYREAGRRWAKAHPDEDRARHRRWSQANPELVKAKHRRAKMARHGLTIEEFEVLAESQDNRCAICRSTDPGGQGEWHVDHDHRCCPGKYGCKKCVRGLLCSRCNVGMGHFNDDPDLMSAAIDYLTARVDRG